MRYVGCVWSILLVRSAKEDQVKGVSSIIKIGSKEERGDV
jgi:hypothetical protein